MGERVLTFLFTGEAKNRRFGLRPPGEGLKSENGSGDCDRRQPAEIPLLSSLCAGRNFGLIAGFTFHIASSLIWAPLFFSFRNLAGCCGENSENALNSVSANQLRI